VEEVKINAKVLVVLLLITALSFTIFGNARGYSIGVAYHFEPVNNGLYGTNATCIEIDANNPNIIYLGTENEGVFVSNDGGKNWTWMGKGLEFVAPNYVPTYVRINAIKSISGKPGVLYASTSKGLYITNNAGINWQRLDNELANTTVYYAYIDPANSNFIIAGTDKGVYLSKDGGVTFAPYNTDIPNISAYTIVKDITDPNAYFIGTNSGIYKTLDNCKTWRRIGNFLNISVLDIVQNPKKPFIIYLATQGGVFRSYDSGSTFVNMTDWTSKPYVIKVYVDPFDDSKVYAVSRDGILSSNDGGETFSIQPNTTGSTFKACEIASPDFSLLYIGTNKGFLTYNKGYFSFSNTGLGLLYATSLGFDQNYKIVYTTTNLGTFKTDYSLSSWTYINNALYGSFAHAIAVDPAKPYNMLAATKVGLKKSIDNGFGWVMIIPNEEIYSVNFSMANPKYVFASGSVLYYSEDSGNNFQAIQIKGVVPPIYAVVPTKNYVYILDSNSILRSLDLVKWEVVSNVSSLKPFALAGDFYNPNTLYLGTLDGVYVSRDGGVTWNVFGDLPRGTIVMSVASINDSKNTILVATNSGVYRSVAIEDNLPPVVTIFSPQDGIKVNVASVNVSGKVVDNESGIAKVTINGIEVTLNQDFTFSYNLLLTQGENTIEIKAYDRAGNVATRTLKVTYSKTVILTLFVGSNKMITSDGEAITLDSPPVIVEGRTLVPIRPIIEKFGGSIAWEGIERKVTIILGNKTIEMWIDKPQARVNGIVTLIDPTNSKVTPKIINGRTMLPVRFVSEQLGAKVDWDGTLKKITITYPAP
jgi:photosystem II stability/assembly factor-like uncharacterized protein